MHRWPSPKATKRLRDGVREITDKRSSGEDVKQIIAKLNTVLRGWGNYFRTGTASREFLKMDSFVYLRLTRWLYRPGGQRKTRQVYWTNEQFWAMGLYRLRGTIRYTAQATSVRSSLSRVRENRTHGLKGVNGLAVTPVPRQNLPMPLAGLRVLAFESRRAPEMAQLIQNQQGEAFVAPSMREVPLAQNAQAFAFAERLFAGEFEMVILLTGVGTRLLDRVLATRYQPGRFAEALRRVTVAVRGPKPAAVLREMGVPIAVQAPEPNTWRELLAAIDGRPERHIAVQEYGKSNTELLDALRARGAIVTPVRVYQWELPEDTAPLQLAAERLAAGEVDVALFTTSVQIHHLMRVAKQAGLEDFVVEGLRKTVVASIGPTTTEALEEYGIRPDLEPAHPKMGFLVQEASQRAGALLKGKR